MMPVFGFQGRSIALGAAIAVTVGLAAGAIPSFTAMRLRIVDALRRV
jgi:ABC-type antimicrobial peptide transport system permease subunit